MKLLSFQPNSLYVNGGCGRVLRRLYAGHELDVISIFVSAFKFQTVGNIREIKINAIPLHRPWMRWKAKIISDYLRDIIFFNYTRRKLVLATKVLEFDIVHIVNHGRYCRVLAEPDVLINKKLWVSFHDHFSLCSSLEDCKFLWEKAVRRFVISKELGEEYQHLFGARPYEILTDGLEESELTRPIALKETNLLQIYFGGLLHIEYLPLFESLANALDKFDKSDIKFTLILRGTQKIKSLENRSFTVDYREDFISDAEVKCELDQADILYLPIKFTHPEFYMYSLSTKMIGYLGAPGVILYHGPQESAVSKLLSIERASTNCFSLQVEEMLKCLNSISTGENNQRIKNKHSLASRKFQLGLLRQQFWDVTKQITYV